MKIKLFFDGKEANAELIDNPASRDFLSLLPLTMHFKDFNRTEKIADLPRKLSKEKAPARFEPKAGDLAVYAPWGNISVFYQSFRYSEYLIPMWGKLLLGWMR